MLISTKNEYFLNSFRMTQTFNFNLNLKILIEFFNIVRSHKIREMKRSTNIIKQSFRKRHINRLKTKNI